MHYYCTKKNMFQVPSKEAVRISPCCHGNEVSVIKSHTIEWHCAKETVSQKDIDGLLENKAIPKCLFCHGDRVSLAMAHSIDVK